MSRPREIEKADLEEVFNNRGSENPFLTTGDIATSLGCSTETARKRLREYDDTFLAFDAGRGQIWLRDGDVLDVRIVELDGERSANARVLDRRDVDLRSKGRLKSEIAKLLP